MSVVPRTFESVITEWTQLVVEVNKTATLEQLPLVTRLGLRGQNLIYEANEIGQHDMLKLARDMAREAVGR